MSNILIRSITGAVFISLVLLPLFWRADVAVGVLGLFMLLGLIEFYQLFRNNELVSVRWESGLILGLFVFGISLSIVLGLLPPLFFLTLIPLAFLIILLELWRHKENPLLNAAILWMGVFYVTVPFILMAAFQIGDKSSFPLLAGMFILIWMNDTFAYLSGRFFGKTKLLERISPKKTWEGTIGGLVFTVLGAAAMSLLFDHERLSFWLISALIIAPCAVLGDLLESLFKRNAGVKDSGTLLPGHGGVLDRFDATLLTAPVFITWTLFYLYF